MKRDEAIFLLDELLKTCPKLDHVFLCLVPPTAVKSIQVGGYQIHMRIEMDKETEKCVRRITDIHGLMVEKSKAEELVIIYRKH